MKRKYFIDLIISLILVFLSIQIKIGAVETSPHVTVNSSYYLDLDMAYTDVYLELSYSPLISPMLFITIPLIKIYGENNNIELYNRENIYIFDHFYLDNEKSEKIENNSKKVTHHLDSYNFSYLYLFISINIIISYFIWSYIIRNILKKYTRTKYFIIGGFILLLIPLLLTHTKIMQNVRTISFFEYSSKYMEYKNRDFLLYNGGII